MPTPTIDTRISPWQIFILFLSFYVLVALAVEVLFPLGPEASALLFYIDTFVCVVFLGDFFANLIRARDKLAYLKWGWLDLISSIPTVQALRWGRLARVVRILRVFRALRSSKTVLEHLFIDRPKGALTTVAILSFSLLVVSSIAILSVETGTEANITTAEEALWWSFVTITTVGYGDHYPVTPEGRIIAAALMTAGVGLFGTFTAYVASRFFGPGEEQQESTSEAVLERLEALSAEVQALRREVAKGRE
jgi:voltage-gated potassium channel